MGNLEHGSSIFSEVQEWWGLVNIDREERSAFQAYQKTDLPQAAQKITSWAMPEFQLSVRPKCCIELVAKNPLFPKILERWRVLAAHGNT